MLCIAMCYGGEPVKRFATGETARLIYVSSSSANPAKMSGVGFPKSAVFEFGEQQFSKLREAWDSGNRSQMERLVLELKPLRQRVCRG